MQNKIKQPPLYMRSGFFIDSLKASTGMGFEQLDKRVRENQYGTRGTTPGLPAPSVETVRDYFRLNHAVAFEPNKKSPVAPWLLAAELEFPGCSAAFFHPIFDLLFGTMESSFFWKSRFCRVPENWIEQAKARGDAQMAYEWEVMNQAVISRKHRSKPDITIDPLSFAHLSLLRLPAEIRDALFDGNGSTPNWTRRYNAATHEIGPLRKMCTMESLTASLALMMEAAEIGDHERFAASKDALLAQIPLLGSHPGCRRIKGQLRQLLVHKCQEMYVREYNGFVHFGFGLPASWRAMEMQKFLPTANAAQD